MEIYIYNKDRDRIGVVQNYTSVQWLKHYDQRGEFVIVLNANEENRQNYQIGHVLHKLDDGTVGYIKFVDIKDGTIEVRGYLDNLSDRINYATAQIRDVETDLYALINKNKRGLEVTTATTADLAAKVETTETTYKELSETLSTVCQQVGLGYRMLYKNGVWGYLEIYKGTLNEDGVFSEEFGNLVVKEYLKDTSAHKNYAIVAGEGEGSNRKIVYVDRSNGGNRYELFVDAKDIQKTYRDLDGKDHTYTDAEYEKVLIERGNQKLDECKAKDDFAVDYDVTNNSFKYGRDWVLGDILKTKSLTYGFIKYMRASSIKEIFEEDYKIVVTLKEAKEW